MEELYLQLLKIALSVFLGLFIGFERDQQNKPAGMRDVSLVTLGATLFALVGLEIIGIENADMSRLFYAPIIGIGFMSSGVILQNKKKTKGLTSAGVLWVMVAIGLLCGLGKYILAIISSIIIYLLLKFKHITVKIKKRKKNAKYYN